MKIIRNMMLFASAVCALAALNSCGDDDNGTAYKSEYQSRLSIYVAKYDGQDKYTDETVKLSVYGSEAEDVDWDTSFSEVTGLEVPQSLRDSAAVAAEREGAAEVKFYKAALPTVYTRKSGTVDVMLQVDEKDGLSGAMHRRQFSLLLSGVACLTTTETKRDDAGNVVETNTYESSSKTANLYFIDITLDDRTDIEGKDANAYFGEGCGPALLFNY